MRSNFFLGLMFFVGAIASVQAKTIQRTVFNADIVASTCHVLVDAHNTGKNQLLFDTYRKSISKQVPPKIFTVRLFEHGTNIPGCSAFLTGKTATLNFGNQGQLDAGGVVTRGAGDNIRIKVQAIDAQADFRGQLTQSNHSVNYPVEFAARGVFRFQAQPVFPAQVKAGEYAGALTFVVTYQ